MYEKCQNGHRQILNFDLTFRLMHFVVFECVAGCSGEKDEGRRDGPMLPPPPAVWVACTWTDCKLTRTWYVCVNSSNRSESGLVMAINSNPHCMKKNPSILTS